MKCPAPLDTSTTQLLLVFYFLVCLFVVCFDNLVKTRVIRKEEPQLRNTSIQVAYRQHCRTFSCLMFDARRI